MTLEIKKPKDYDSRVFINCPFDDKFKPIFDAMIFAIHDLGFQARHALIDNDTALRVDRIARELATSKYSLHDMSRVQLSANKMPRFNMPFEAGLAYALHVMQPYKLEHHLGILDSVAYQHQKSISDLAGIDARVHNNDPMLAISCVREFLRRKSEKKLPGATHIQKRYGAFQRLLGANARKAKVSLKELKSWAGVLDFQALTADWIKGNPP